MKELLKTGLLTVFFNFSSQWLSVLAYISLFAGFAMQAILLHKQGKPKIRWIYPAILALAILVCELLTWTITGWDRVYISLVYLCVLGNAFGVILAAIVHGVKQRRALSTK